MASISVHVFFSLAIIITFAGRCDAGVAVNKTRLENYLEDLFSTGRSYKQPTEQNIVRGKIYNFFQDTLKTLTPNSKVIEYPHRIFYDNQDRTLINYVVEVAGTRYQTPQDKPVLIGAHYDSQTNTPGVDDNGSGMAVLFETLTLTSELLKRNTCVLENTIIFIAFDYEEFGLIGSQHYVDYDLIPVLESIGIPHENFQVALILETMMNHNTTPNSQLLPPGFETIFEDAVEILEDNEYRGDFLAVVHRRDEAELIQLLLQQWADISVTGDPLVGDYKMINMSTYFYGRPSELPPKVQTLLRDFFRSDHHSFWDSDGNYTDVGLKALFITDTANFRGSMIECYHMPCDDFASVTPERIEFLALSTQTMFQSLLVLSTEDPDITCLRAFGERTMGSFFAVALALTVAIINTFK